MAKGPFQGVLVPVVTPFKSDFTPDIDRFVAICNACLAQGADGLAIFGTTSEANSTSLTQRENMLDALLEAGVPAAKLMPGTGACSLTDAIRLTSKAVDAGCGGVLMLPPFYYKNVNEDGIFAFMSETIQAVGSDALNIYLYHIPPQAVIGFPVNLMRRLLEAYPTVITGVKDSSGDWTNTANILKELPDLDVFPGSEVFLLDGLRAGGKGCITATGSVNIPGIRKVFENWNSDEADRLQAAANEVRTTIQRYPMISALKAIIAHFTRDPEWQRVLPPLLPLSGEQTGRLLADLERIGFAFDTGSFE